MHHLRLSLDGSCLAQAFVLQRMLGLTGDDSTVQSQRQMENYGSERFGKLKRDSLHKNPFERS
jgi:hypothetical protein